jgi:hypothetical protein
MRDSLKALALAAAAATSLAGTPASAHHSFAMFDENKTMTLEGTVKEFQWANPHIWVQLLVKDPATGKDIEWSIEGASVTGLTRQGWSRKSVKTGDQARVVIHPLKSGELGGTLLSLSVNRHSVGQTPKAE